MPAFFHAVTVDYDGTLTETPRPGAEVLAAVRAIRESGRKCVLVTGRILSELRADFPDVDDQFDAIVGENGAVISIARHVQRPLGPPVSAELEASLRLRGVPLRRGDAILATDGAYDVPIAEEVRRLGLEVQLVRNRAALMILPAGVNKGTGVTAALEALGLSRHSTVGIGDAENDHSLLDACEVGVAVANAIPQLQAHADLVLAAPDGRGVGAFLQDIALGRLPTVEPRRWQLTLGVFPDGTPAVIPASHVNIGVYGGSGSGKSYVAGLIADQLIAMSYAVCVIDLEGDHVTLGERHGVVVTGGREAPAPPGQVAHWLHQGLTSVIVDLSLLAHDTKRAYARALLAELFRMRRQSGIPHWVVVEEAHQVMPSGHDDSWCHDSGETGLCLVSYSPERLCPGARERAEIVIDLNGEEGPTLLRHGWPAPRRFMPAERVTRHVRHWHKYVEGALPSQRRFYFRNNHGLTGRVAADLTDFLRAVRSAEPAVLRHHAALADFSRWIADLMQHRQLTSELETVERDIAAASEPSEMETLRTRLVDLLARRLREGGAVPDGATLADRVG